MPKTSLENALNLARETQFLKIGKDIVREIPTIFKTQFPGKKSMLIADKNTYAVAGKSIHRLLSDKDLEACDPLVIDDPNLYANYYFVQQVKEYLKQVDGIAIAVGSGVINDLTKLSSAELGRPYMCVATAASMDGYSAFGASITKEGAKQTMKCSAPQVIVGDLNTISAAPAINNASGYADLYAKIPGGADWIFADALGEESLDYQSWHIVQDGLSNALKDPSGVKAGTVSAIEPLIEGLMLGGFAMQSYQSSRPASGAEHQFSHTWDMEHHTFKGEMARKYGLYKEQDEQVPSHGFKVGIGLLTTTALYERVLETSFEQLDVKKAVALWKPLENQIEEVNKLFEEEGPRKFAAEQITGKYIEKDALEKQLYMLKENWLEIKERLKEQIIPYHKAKEALALAGAPVECEHIGITKSRLKKTFYKAQKIRTRFTVLDVAVRTGYLNQWIDELY